MHRTQGAYNAEEVTAAFDLRNLRARVNRELDAHSDPAQWRHRARYNAAQGRSEMRFVPRLARPVALQGQTFHFAEGDTIDTENPCKNGKTGIRDLAPGAGFTTDTVWAGADRLVRLHLLQTGNADEG